MYKSKPPQRLLSSAGNRWEIKVENMFATKYVFTLSQQAREELKIEFCYF